MNNEIPQQKFLDKIDQTIIGFVLGLILPMLMFVIYYKLRFNYMSWNEYVSSVKQFAILPSIIKVCVFINLPFFFLFNLVQKFNLCKGIFISSMLYIIAMFVIKYAL
ncbi:MAG: hypothetical protein U0U67_09800 [Chitinophagales bacterium]